MKAAGMFTQTLPTTAYTHQGHRLHMSWSPLSEQPTALKLPQAAMGYIAQPPPRARVRWSVVCIHTTQSQTLLAFPDENSLYTKGRVSGYWNQRQGVWSFRVGGRMSGH